MIITNLRLNNFKNFEEKTFELGGVINAFAGNNGVGKTNILDAVYMLAFGKSYFNLKLNQIIRHGAGFFSVKGHFLKDNIDEIITVSYRKGEKKIIARNDKPYEKLSEHIGLIPVVMISPYDRDLISEGSEVRRKFMDKLISQFDKNYLLDLTSYYQTLSQRNSLLKYFALNNVFDEETLLVYDEKLHGYGHRIFDKRKQFIEAFRPYLLRKYAWLSREAEVPGLNYRSHLFDKPLKELLLENRKKDAVLQYTSAGIHRDDLVFELNGYPVRKFGSQGQQKSFLIALKLAEYEMLKSRKNEAPILLFDDIFDKLDALRVEQIIKWVEEKQFGQVLITDTHPQRIEKLLRSIDGETKIFRL